MIPFFIINSKHDYHAIKNTNQMNFLKFLFHFIEVAVSTGFMRKKRLFLTGYAQHNSILWKSCGLCFFVSIFQ